MSASSWRLLKVLAALFLLGGGGLALLVGAYLLSEAVDARERERREASSRWYEATSAQDEVREGLSTRLAELKTAREAQAAAVTARIQEAQARAAEEALARAKEGLTVCNYSSASTVQVSFVTWQSASSAWMGHGWYNIKNGSCSKVLSTIEGPYIYLFGHAGARRWGGDLMMCTTSGPFTLMDPGRSACRDGTPKPFAAYTPTDRAFTWSLRDG